VKKAELRDYETNIKQNGWLLVQLAYVYSQGEDLKDFYGFPEIMKRTDTKAIRTATRTYFNLKNYVQVTLMPEGKPKEKK